ncbi:MAG: hypothetical protein ACRD6N_00295, partial [Pyrinomonadaceae bacterium]
MANPDVKRPAQTERPDDTDGQPTDGAFSRRPAESSAPDVDVNESPEQADVIYRRLMAAGDGGQSQRPPENMRARAREIAPMVTPLLIGFTLLLVLIFLLGYLSVRRMDYVSFNALDMERQHSARLGLLLELRLAVTKLNNEARARHEAESRRELKPPFDFRLGTAREDVVRLLRELERPPL